MTHTLRPAFQARRHVPAALFQALWLAVLAVLGAGQAFAQTYEESKKPLAAAVEKVLNEFADKSEVEKRKQLTDYFDAILKRVDAAVKLTPEESAALKQENAKAVESSIILWRPRFLESLRTFLTRGSEPAAIRHIGQWKPPIAAHREPVEGWTAPDRDPLWIAALKTRLGDQRYAEWRKADDVVQATHDASMAEYVKRWSAEYHSVMSRAIQLKIDEWTKALKPSEERITALKAAIEKMMEQVLETEQKRATAMLRPMPPAARKSIMTRKSFYLRFPFSTGADLNNVWQETLNGTLTREEMTAWTQHVTEQKAELEKSVSKIMKSMLAEIRKASEQMLGMESKHIISALNLPADRAEGFKAVTKAAVDAMEARWQERTREYMALAGSETVKQMVNAGRFYFGYEEDDLPQTDAAWNDGIKALLSPEEWKRLDAIKAEDKLKRNRIMGQIMLAELDQQVLFTVSQREQLQPVAERLAKNLPDLRIGFGYDVNLQTFFTAAKGATDAELTPILDANQRAHWRETCNKEEKNAEDEGGEKSAVPQPKVAPKVLEPEDFEHRLSEFLQEKTTGERQRMLAQMILRAEDAARVAGLAETVAARLRTAAKGATEHVLTPWKSRIEQVVRAAAKGVSAQNLKQHLGRLEEYHFRQHTSVTPATHVIWTATVEVELTEPQRAAWKKEIDARKAFREQAVAGVVLGDFDRRYKLTVSQWTKLEPVIRKVVSDYSQDIGGYFSSSSPWYFQSYSALLPFAAVPEKDLQALLTKDQWDRWAGEGLANVSSYWDTIKQIHDSRVKLVK